MRKDAYVQEIIPIFEACKKRGFVGATEFNDHLTTTHEDVLELLREAIDERSSAQD